MYKKLALLKYLSLIAASIPSPGGGSAAAYAAAMGSALGSMVAGLSLNKTTSKNARKRLRLYRNKFQRNYRILLDLAEKDARIYNKVIQAYKLPKQTDSQRHKRSLAIQQALKKAMKPPLQVMEYSLNTLSLMRHLTNSVNNNLMSDIGTGVLLTQAGFDGALLNVKINLKSIKDKKSKRLTRKQIETLLGVRLQPKPPR